MYEDQPFSHMYLAIGLVRHYRGREIPISEVFNTAAENCIDKDDLPDFTDVIEAVGGTIDFKETA